MRIIIVTQDEPFYLGKHIDYLFCSLPAWVNICGVVILGASPFGKAESFWKRAKKTLDVFGLVFFLRYSSKYIKAKFIDRRFLIKNIIRKYGLDEIKLPTEDINAKKCLELFANFKPDLIISIMANQIFRKDILSLPKYGCINLHMALLPKYRGLMPTFWALKNNEKETGVSVFFMDEGVDTGEILIQKRIPIETNDSLEVLINKTKKAGMDAILEAINLIKSCQYNTIKNLTEKGSYYTFPTKNDVREFLCVGKKFW